MEAVHVQQLSLIQSNIESVPCKPLLTLDLGSRYELESQILRLGKLEVFGKNGISVKDAEPYRVQEYQDADKDHESFNKSIKLEDNKLTEVGESDVSITADNSCLCNSSFESSVESEKSISNCTIIEREIASDNDLASPDRVGFALDVTNENLKEASGDDVESLKEPCFSEEFVNSNFVKDINANKEEQDSGNSESKNCQIRRDSGEHPKQIQQWLQQILVETETEPMIHEIEQFSEISKARLSGQFPLET